MLKNWKTLWNVMRRLKFDKFILGFILWFVATALIIWAVEPNIDKIKDAFWYTFVACTSIGFGDVTVVTFVGRILTVLITIYELILVALFSGVVVSYYLELIKRRENEVISDMLDKLTHLTELSQDELQEIESKAKKVADK